MSRLTHARLVEISVKLAHQLGFPLALTEQKAAVRTGEIPDVLAFRGGGDTLLIECKTSRSDWLADHRKDFRIHPEKGMGMFRILVDSRGVTDADLYECWDEIVIGDDGKVVSTTLPSLGNMTLSSQAHQFNERNKDGELAMLYSYARRKKK